MSLSLTQVIIDVLLMQLIVLYLLSISMATRIYSVVTLILSYIIVSVIALLNHQTFIAVILLMIYAGAISIFFIFMVMLLNVQKQTIATYRVELSSFIIFVLLFSVVGLLIIRNFENMLMVDNNHISTLFRDHGVSVIFEEPTMLGFDERKSYMTWNYFITMTTPNYASDLNAESFVTNANQLLRIGYALYTGYVYAFMGAGLLLLIAIVGVTVLFSYTPRLQKSRELDCIQVLRAFKKK